HPALRLCIVIHDFIIRRLPNHSEAYNGSCADGIKGGPLWLTGLGGHAVNGNRSAQDVRPHPECADYRSSVRLSLDGPRDVLSESSSKDQPRRATQPTIASRFF